MDSGVRAVFHTALYMSDISPSVLSFDKWKKKSTFPSKLFGHWLSNSQVSAAHRIGIWTYSESLTGLPVYNHGCRFSHSMSVGCENIYPPLFWRTCRGWNGSWRGHKLVWPPRCHFHINPRLLQVYSTWVRTPIARYPFPLMLVFDFPSIMPD